MICLPLPFIQYTHLKYSLQMFEHEESKNEEEQNDPENHPENVDFLYFFQSLHKEFLG